MVPNINFQAASSDVILSCLVFLVICLSNINFAVVDRQSSGSFQEQYAICQAVFRQSSGSRQSVSQLSSSHHAVVRQSSGKQQAVFRNSTPVVRNSTPVVRQSLGSQQAVVSQSVSQSSVSRQAVIMQMSGKISKNLRQGCSFIR